MKSAPKSSIAMVMKIMLRRVVNICDTLLSGSIKSLISILFCDGWRPANISPKNEVKVMMPIPPNCIRKRMMTCPAVVNVEAISIVVSPVTHTALVAVNKASKNEMPLTVARGKSKSPVPAKIIVKKLPTIIQLGDILVDSEWVMTADSLSRASMATMAIIR